MELRDYQKELIRDIRKSITEGNHRIMVQSPPRSGKTVVMAHIAKGATDKGNRVLFFSHRKEINEQVIATFERNGVSMDLFDIGTVGTIARRLDKLIEPSIILVDEAHHIKAKTYQKILNYFENSFQLFFTGTPIRTNGEGFKDLADDLVLGKSVKWLQDRGNISLFDYYSLELIDREKLKKSRGDFTEKSIEESLETWKMLQGDYVKHYEELANGKQAIVYTATVERAKKVAEAFENRGHSAAVIHGATPKIEREEKMEDFRKGRLMIMVNVNLFTEGIDLPNVDVCIMLRPTQSLSLYLQFAMRALNPREGKRAILIDHVGNWKIHGRPDMDRKWSIDGTKKAKKEDNGPSIIECEQCYSVFFRNEVKDNKCPTCGEKLREEKPLQTVKKLDGKLVKLPENDLVVLNLNGNDYAMSQSDADITYRVKKYRSYKLCQSLKELKAFALIHNYKPGWTYYKQKELNIWR